MGIFLRAYATGALSTLFPRNVRGVLCEYPPGDIPTGIDLTAEEIDEVMEDILFSKEDTRVAISYYFLRVLGVPPEFEWTGTDGAIHKTMRAFNPKYARKNRTNYNWVRNIFFDLLEAIAKCKKIRNINDMAGWGDARSYK